MADVPVADAVEAECTTALSEAPVDGAERELLELLGEERRGLGKPAAVQVVLEVADARRGLGYAGETGEIHPQEAVPGGEVGLAVRPPLADRAELPAIH